MTRRFIWYPVTLVFYGKDKNVCDFQCKNSELRVYRMSQICEDSLRFTLGLVLVPLRRYSTAKEQESDFSGFPGDCIKITKSMFNRQMGFTQEKSQY